MIDRARIDELRADFGPDGFADVVAIFLEETTPVVDRLATGSSRDTVADLHFVKGSADNMGLVDLAAICRRGEAALATGDRPDLAGLRTTYRDGCAALLAPVA